MEAAQSLHCHDLSLPDRFRRLNQGVVVRCQHRAGTIPQFQVRAADRAGVRLGVEAAIQRVFIFFAAGRTQREALHRRVGTVVGQRLDDRKARATVGAVDERVAVAAVGGIEQLAQTVRADAQVRQDQRRLAAARVAAANLEERVAGGVEVSCLNALDQGAGGLILLDAAQKRLQARGIALDLDHHALGRIVHPPGKIKVGRQSIDKRAKAHSLHRPAHQHARPADACIIDQRALCIAHSKLSAGKRNPLPTAPYCRSKQLE